MVRRPLPEYRMPLHYRVLRRLNLGPAKPCAGDWREPKLLGLCPHYEGDSLPFPQQPVNAYSNGAYALAGWVAAWHHSFAADGVVFALAMTALAIGSFAYHAWPTNKTAALDHFGMYAAFIALTTHATGGSWLPMALGAGVGGYLLRYEFRPNLNMMMGLLLWFSLMASLPPLTYVSMGAFVLAMVAWQIDRRTVWLGRWGHGIWHVLTAAAISLMFAAAA